MDAANILTVRSHVSALCGSLCIHCFFTDLSAFAPSVWATMRSPSVLATMRFGISAMRATESVSQSFCLELVIIRSIVLLTIAYMDIHGYISDPKANPKRASSIFWNLVINVCVGDHHCNCV